MVDSIIQFAADTAANWATQNPVVPAGVPAWEMDTHQGKVGDGVTHYNDLPYGLSGNAVSGVQINDSGTSTAFVWSSAQSDSADQTILQAAQKYADSAVQGLFGRVDCVLQNSDGTWGARPNAVSVTAFGYPGRTDPPSWLVFQSDIYRYLAA